MGFDELVQHDASELTKGTLPAERLPSEGVDADTLDGVEGSNYARTNVTENFGGDVTFGSGATPQSTVQFGHHSSISDVAVTMGRTGADRAVLEWNRDGTIDATIGMNVNEELLIENNFGGPILLQGDAGFGGETAPSYAVDVNGDINAQGQLKENGNPAAILADDETITGHYDFGDAPGVNSRLNVDVRSNSNVTSASGWGSDDIFNPADYDTATFGRRNAGHGLSAIRIIAQRDAGTTVGSRIGVLTNDVGNERLSIRFGITSMTEVISIRAAGGVGIGATFPINTLGVNGAAVIGSSFAGSNTAPTDGLLVEGKIEMSSNGAGLFVNSNGDVVAVDDSGNTNVLT